MAVDIDTREPLRGLAKLEALVRAVVGAGDADESDWLEWKSTLDLSSKDGCFQVARTILGMANRLPDTAARFCGGVGYIVVGANPSQLGGIASVDPAVLDPLMSVYVGGVRGPAWTPTWVQVDGKMTLVVTVEAPRAGDQIWPLRKELLGEPGGRIFVRRNGATVPANADEIDLLCERVADLHQALPDLAVTARVDEPLSWYDHDAAADEIRELVSTWRDELLARAEERDRASRTRDEDERELVGLEALQVTAQVRAAQRQLAEAARQFDGFLTKPDPRTLDEYSAELDDWAQRMTAAAIEDLPARLLDGERNLVSFTITNNSGRFLPDVELRISFPWEPLRGFSGPPEVTSLPGSPRDFGEPELTDFARHLQVPNLNLYNTGWMPHASMPSRSWIEDGSINVVFDVGDLRPGGTDTTEDFSFLVPARSTGATLHGTWAATMRDVDGTVTGTLDLPLHPEPVDVAAIYFSEDDEDS